MHPETFHVVDRTRQSRDFELATVAGTRIDLANRQRAPEQMLDPFLQCMANLNGRGIPGLQDFGRDPRFPDLPRQQHWRSSAQQQRDDVWWETLRSLDFAHGGCSTRVRESSELDGVSGALRVGV